MSVYFSHIEVSMRATIRFPCSSGIFNEEQPIYEMISHHHSERVRQPGPADPAAVPVLADRRGPGHRHRRLPLRPLARAIEAQRAGEPRLYVGVVLHPLRRRLLRHQRPRGGAPTTA